MRRRRRIKIVSSERRIAQGITKRSNGKERGIGIVKAATKITEVGRRRAREKNQKGNGEVEKKSDGETGGEEMNNGAKIRINLD